MDRRTAAPARVPDVVGLPVGRAQDAVLDAGLLPVAADQQSGRRPDLIVTGQQPRRGAQLGVGGRVQFWSAPPPPGPDSDDGPDQGGGGGLARLGPRPTAPSGTKKRT